MTDTDTLRTLRTVINRMLCEEEGHEWEEIGINLEADAPMLSNAGTHEKCKRCEKTRRRVSTTNTTNADFGIEPDITISSNQCNQMGCPKRAAFGGDYCLRHTPHKMIGTTEPLTPHWDSGYR